MSDIDFGAIGSDLAGSIVGVAKDFYKEQGKEMLDAEKAFFESLAGDGKTCLVELAKAKVAGDDSKVEEWETNLRTLASTAKMQVASAALDLEEQAKVSLGNILTGVFQIVGKGLLAGIGIPL